MAYWVHQKRMICLGCCLGCVLLLSGCSWMYTELEEDDIRRAVIRDREIELENMKLEYEEGARLGRPVNPPNPVMPGDVEPELE